MGSIGENVRRIENAEMEDNDREEKILVLVRVRPLSEKETASNETSDWECINDTTILYRNTLREGSTYPSAYSFDRVFRGDCSTRQVYREGVKDVAISVVRGINSCVFAYGQTSSGKTYTMMGITEYTVSDIFDYMEKVSCCYHCGSFYFSFGELQNRERAFVLKFSAIEIYNEAIRDLLSSDTSALRLLDDQEKGTVVERITEEPLRDWSHLQELLSICEAQRKIGETSLNEKSSRSHQILKLTIESSSREFLNKESSATLSASVNFVDLAGSERASQVSSNGTRLKEGCHINRSLLTLGTVIRKLSKGGKQGHINYRDSKLTRLLQPALGGNSRTAIICTMSPARTHVEQTRNTLLFACCAKEVSTRSQVNVVMSDKALVKHLQRELARLENELRSPALPSSDGELLKKKDAQIQKMEREIAELTSQRDLAEARVQDLLRIVGHEKDDSVSITDSYLSTCANTPLHFSFRRQPIQEESNGYCKEVEIDRQCESTSNLNDQERAGDSQNGVVGSPETANRGAWIMFDRNENGGMSRSFSKSSLGSAKAEEEIPTVQAFVAELRDMANEEYERHKVGGENWVLETEKKRKEIIRLWEACHVSLIHRTYFSLLFKGGPSDSIYVEVEHRRVAFLEGTGGGGREKKVKAERAMLSKLMRKRLTEEERRRMYGEWGIDLKSKQRRHQVAAKLWSSADDGDHVARSAALVAKLVRFADQGTGNQGMFAFTFTPPPPSSRRRSFAWSFSRSSLL